MMLPILLLISLVLFSGRCVLEAFQVLLNCSTSFTQISLIIFYFSWLIGIVCIISWCYLVWKSKRNNFRYDMSHDEYQGLVYFTTLIMVSVISVIVNIHFQATTWSNANEVCLVSYIYIQLVASVFFTGECCRFYYRNNTKYSFVIYSTSWSYCQDGCDSNR